MFRVMTFNLRYAEAADGPNRWELRRPLVARLLSQLHPAVVGLQEVLPEQRLHLAEDLPAYAGVGEGREGAGRGEHCLILWRHPLLLIGAGSFWLSPTPEKSSRGWDALLPRICTWTQVLVEGRPLQIFNLHLDHWGQEARRKGLSLVRERISGSSVVMGDFNDDGLGLPGMVEVRPAGDLTTYHDFLGGPGPRLDFLFVTPDLRVVSSETVRYHEEGRYHSDHFPVMADLEWSEP